MIRLHGVPQVNVALCRNNRVGGRPLLERPSSHTTVRTVRYTAVQQVPCKISNHLARSRSSSYLLSMFGNPSVSKFCTVPVSGLAYYSTLRFLRFFGFHPIIPRAAGFPRFLLSLHCLTLLSFVRLPLFSPSRSVRTPSTRDIPLSGTMASADFWTLSHTSLYGLLRFIYLMLFVQTSPGRGR